MSKWGIALEFHLSLATEQKRKNRTVSFLYRNLISLNSKVKQEFLTIPKDLSSSPVFSKVHFAQSLVICVVFCGSLSFCVFSFFVTIVLSVFVHFWLVLSVFDLRLIIIPLVYSNFFSHLHNTYKTTFTRRKETKQRLKPFHQ